MTLTIGTTVAAAPAPKPAAVNPAASPRRSANHFSALPTHVPYTAPAPTPDDRRATYSIGSESQRVDRPRDRDKDAAEHHHDPRAEAIDEPAFDRHQPGFGGDENRERDLDAGRPQWKRA